MEKVTHLSVHLYTCHAESWKEFYAPDKGTVIDKLIRMLDTRMNQGTDEGEMDWHAFFHSRKIMVTETNCNRDRLEDIFSTPQVQCMKITGQFSEDANEGAGRKSDAGLYYGEGSIAEIMGMDNISHFAWWNACNANTKDIWRISAMSMLDQEGNLTATGRALTNGLDAEKSECNADTWYVDLGEGREVLRNDAGGYFDICSKDYLGHVEPREGAKNDFLFDIT